MTLMCGWCMTGHHDDCWGAYTPTLRCTCCDRPRCLNCSARTDLDKASSVCIDQTACLGRVLDRRLAVYAGMLKRTGRL